MVFHGVIRRCSFFLSLRISFTTYYNAKWNCLTYWKKNSFFPCRVLIFALSLHQTRKELHFISKNKSHRAVVSLGISIPWLVTALFFITNLNTNYEFRDWCKSIESFEVWKRKCIFAKMPYRCFLNCTILLAKRG